MVPDGFREFRRWTALLATLLFATASPAAAQSVARTWDEALLDAIRLDYPAPTVHARNLFHLSAAMYDAWAAYEPAATGVFVDEVATAEDIEAARAKAISFAAYRILRSRFVVPKCSPGAAAAAATEFPALMQALGYDPNFVATEGGVDPPAELGNRIAAAILAFGLADGSNEGDVTPYSDASYTPLNPPMAVDLPGVLQPTNCAPGVPGCTAPELPFPNHWQPLSLDFLVLQNGIIVGQATQKFLGSAWGNVIPFAAERSAPGDVLHDQGPPPAIGCEFAPPCDSDTAVKDDVVEVIRKSSQLDPDDGAMIDIGPGAWGNNPLGTNDGVGYELNPYTGEPYAPNVVNFADYARVLAEFWADGPSSETPPGHWNTIANAVSDSPSLWKRIAASGPVVNDLEWDVKLYLALNGALHDAAITAWDHKRHYDSARPITQIRYMGGKGQSSDPMGPSYDPRGLPLVPGLIEVVSAASSAPGERHANVLNDAGQPAIGEIAIYTWPGQPPDPENQYSGAQWIRAIEWLPYQRETFVTPPFAGYISGHSTFSRAAAVVLTRFTGVGWFPGGLGTFTAPQHTFLAFEIGPTQPVQLQWARYEDAADQAGLSRLFGGIHPRADDFAGRRAGAAIGAAAFAKARSYFPAPEPGGAVGAIVSAATLLWIARRRTHARRSRATPLLKRAPAPPNGAPRIRQARRRAHFVDEIQARRDAAGAIHPGNIQVASCAQVHTDGWSRYSVALAMLHEEFPSMARAIRSRVPVETLCIAGLTLAAVVLTALPAAAQPWWWRPPPSAPLQKIDARITRVETELAAVRDLIGTIEKTLTPIEGLQRCVRVFEGELGGLPGPHILFTRCNVHVRSGELATDAAVNGLGNLIVGYNEGRCFNLDAPGDGTSSDPRFPKSCLSDRECSPGFCDFGERSGSHNLIVGQQHSYSSQGGIVAGRANTVSAPSSTVAGGYYNEAKAPFASVYGGASNTAAGEGSAVVSGKRNVAEGADAVVLAGEANRARGAESAVVAGRLNRTIGVASTVVGGGGVDLLGNPAGNRSTGPLSAILGGQGNATGSLSPNDAFGRASTVAGGYNNNASGEVSTVSGGQANVASGTASAVSGGAAGAATSTDDWVAGGLFEDD